MVSEVETNLDNASDLLDLDVSASGGGFIKFYGLYWSKKSVDWGQKELWGQPEGWTGKGRIASSFDRKSLQMNFWGQKGVYILYDDGLRPVYAGQAGLTRKGSRGGQGIGERLNNHHQGIYRHGWSLFSWFGFLDLQKFDLKNEEDEMKRKNPPWDYKPRKESNLNLLLASFEAILIEGFAPRFNARGGDLGAAVLVDQFEQ